MSETALFDRLFIGDGEYVRADTAINTVGALNAEIASLRAQLDEARSKANIAILDAADLAGKLDEARRKAIEECILVVKKERRTKVIGPDTSPRERRAWDKCRYDTFKSAEDAIRALLSESKS